jgi:3-carboxy-cis,cis-muconate cycloisomerase
VAIAFQQTTAEMAAVFSDESEVQSWLDVEAALAQAQGRLGVIPAEAAAEIQAKAKVENIDLDALRAEMATVVHPMVPLVRLLAAACEPPHGEYVHWGATTTDILDTGLTLRLRRAEALIVEATRSVRDRFAQLAVRHRDTPQAGRTHGQHAVPLTFGFKLSVWVDELDRILALFDRDRAEILAGQLGGAVSTLASMGPDGPAVRETMMEILGLTNARIPWGVSRDRFTRFGANAALLATSLQRFGAEVFHLQRTEIGEVTEPFHRGKVGSSTMPHKRNPALCETVITLGHLIRNDVGLAFTAAGPVHEREKFSYTLEMVYVPQVCEHLHRMLELTDEILAGLTVHGDRMQANLQLTDGLIASESLMMALSATLGRRSRPATRSPSGCGRTRPCAPRSPRSRSRPRCAAPTPSRPPAVGSTWSAARTNPEGNGVSGNSIRALLPVHCHPSDRVTAWRPWQT